MISVRSEVQVLPGPPYFPRYTNRLFPSGEGGVAQLGERLLCKQEVIGSIPFTSTILEIGGMRRGRILASEDPCFMRRMRCMRNKPARVSFTLFDIVKRSIRICEKSQISPCEEHGHISCRVIVCVGLVPAHDEFRESSAIRAFGGCLGTERR